MPDFERRAMIAIKIVNANGVPRMQASVMRQLISKGSKSVNERTEIAGRVESIEKVVETIQGLILTDQ